VRHKSPNPKSIQFTSRSPVASALRVTPATLADVPRDLIDSRVVAAMIAAENISPVGLAFRNWGSELGIEGSILCQIRRVHQPSWSEKSIKVKFWRKESSRLPRNKSNQSRVFTMLRMLHTNQSRVFTMLRMLHTNQSRVFTMLSMLHTGTPGHLDTHTYEDKSTLTLF
jgi:hypothetical protein